jgi:hypothetical protein
MRRPLFERLPVLLVLPISLLALASCGGPQWDPSAPDACRVVTEWDAALALGEFSGPGVSGVPYTNFPYYKCHYGPLDDNKSVDVWISPRPEESTAGNQLAAFTEWVQSQLASGEISGMKSLNGIGDAAYMFPATAPTPAQWQLVFLKGTDMVTIFVPLNGRDSVVVEQLTIDLARTVANRM